MSTTPSPTREFIFSFLLLVLFPSQTYIASPFPPSYPTKIINPRLLFSRLLQIANITFSVFYGEEVNEERWQPSELQSPADA